MTIDSAPVNAVQDSVIYGPQSNAFVINHLEVVELTVFNWDKGNHPCESFFRLEPSHPIIPIS
jgi:hypothetical protein